MNRFLTNTKARGFPSDEFPRYDPSDPWMDSLVKNKIIPAFFSWPGGQPSDDLVDRTCKEAAQAYRKDGWDGAHAAVASAWQIANDEQPID